jgi:hypothetical protein
MKKFFFLAAAFVLTSAVAFAQPKPDDVIKVSEEKHDFGKIKQGVPVVTYFEVTNTSGKPIIIENAWASCGCTIPEYQKEPILAGKSAKIKVQFNAAQAGPFTKDVFIKLAGIEVPKNLKITGEVQAGK